MINLLQKIINNNNLLNNPDITFINRNCNYLKITILVIKDALENNKYNILNNEYISSKDIFLLDKKINKFSFASLNTLKSTFFIFF